MRVLVTRPEVDAEPLVTELAARGHEALLQPLLAIAPVVPAPALDLGGVQALLFTSANGLRAFAGLSEERGLPAFAVGDATAEAAQAAGFDDVESAAGDVEDLVHLIAERLDPAAGPLFHGAGARLAGDLKDALEGAGFSLRRAVLYKAKPAKALSDEVRDALAAGRIAAALFFSPRTAETFVRLIEQHGLVAACGACRAVCLSQAVAAKLERLPWAAITVAARPDRQALLEALDNGEDRHEERGEEQGKAMTEDSADDGAGPGSGGDGGGASAERVIAAFGGIRPAASKLGVAVSTVQGWKERGAIPKARHAMVRAAARRHGVALDDAGLAAEGLAGKPAAAKRKPAGRSSPKPKVPAAARLEIIEPGSDTAASEAAVPAGTRSERPLPHGELAPRAESGGPGPRPDRPSEMSSAATAAARLAQLVGSDSRPAAPPRRPGYGLIAAGFGLGVLVMALGFGAAVWTRDLWAPAGPAGTGSEPRVEIAALRDDVEALRTELAEAPAAGVSETGRELTGTLDRLSAAADDLAKRLDRLEDLAAPAADLDARVSALEDGTSVPSDLEARIAQLEDRPETPGTGAEELAALVEADRALAARLALLEQRRGEIGRLERELEILAARQSGPTGSAAGQVALVLTLGALRDAVLQGRPYAAELERMLRQLGPDRDLAGVLGPIEAQADGGVPTLGRLRRSFAEMARSVVTASAGDQSDGWASGVLRRLTDVITVRPLGDVEGDEPGAVVARAEARLQADDLAGAVAELAGLSGAAAEAAASWRAEAGTRLAAEAALGAFAGRLVEILAPADG